MSSKSSRSCSRSYSRSKSKSSTRSFSSRSYSSSRSRSHSKSLSSRSSRSSSRRYKNSRNTSYSSSRSRSRSRKRTPKLTSSGRIRTKNTNYTYNATSAFNQNYKNKDRFSLFSNLSSNRNKNVGFNFNKNEDATSKVKRMILSHSNLNNKAKEDCVKRKLKAKMEKEASEKLKQNEEKNDHSPVIPITSYQNKSDSEEDEQDEEKKNQSPIKKLKIDNKSDEEKKEKTKTMLNVLSKLKKKSLNTSNETKMTLKAPIIKAGQLSKNKIDEVPVSKLIGPKLPYYKKQSSEIMEEQKDKIKSDLQPINYSQDDMAKYDELLKRSQMYAKYNQVSVFNLGPNGETQIKMVELDKNDKTIENENPIQLQPNELYGLSVPEDVTLKNVGNQFEDENQSLKDVNTEEIFQNDILQQHHAQNLFLHQSQLQLSHPLNFIPIQNPLQQVIQLPNSGLNLNMLHSNSLNLIQAPSLNLLQQPIMTIQNPGLPIQYITAGQIGQQFIQLRPSLSALTPQPQFILNSPFYRILPQ